MTLDFLSSISLGWMVMFLDSHRSVFIFRSKFDRDLLAVVQAVLIVIKNASNYLKIIDTW